MVAILGFLTWRNYRSSKVADDVYDYVLLALEIPRDNDKKELSAEQLFASLHGILRDKQELKMSGGVQEHLSFEIASVGGQIRFKISSKDKFTPNIHPAKFTKPPVTTPPIRAAILSRPLTN